MRAPPYPHAIFLLAEGMRRRYRISPEKAVAEAKALIEGLNTCGYQVGPMAAFGPQERRGPSDPFDSLAQMAGNIERVMGRKPWEIH